jgi:hypothetical protein
MTKDLGAFGGRQHPNQRRDQPARDDALYEHLGPTALMPSAISGESAPE